MDSISRSQKVSKPFPGAWWEPGSRSFPSCEMGLTLLPSWLDGVGTPGAPHPEVPGLQVRCPPLPLTKTPPALGALLHVRATKIWTRGSVRAPDSAACAGLRPTLGSKGLETTHSPKGGRARAGPRQGGSTAVMECANVLGAKVTENN